MAEDDADERIGYRVGGIAVLGTSRTRGEWWCKKWEYVTKWSAWLEASAYEGVPGRSKSSAGIGELSIEGRSKEERGSEDGEGL
jgi:hypothetical protein